MPTCLLETRTSTSTMCIDNCDESIPTRSSSIRDHGRHGHAIRRGIVRPLSGRSIFAPRCFQAIGRPPRPHKKVVSRQKIRRSANSFYLSHHSQSRDQQREEGKNKATLKKKTALQCLTVTCPRATTRYWMPITALYKERTTENMVSPDCQSEVSPRI